MGSKQAFADLYADRLMLAKDKQKATEGILRRMNRLTHKKDHALVTQDEKAKIVGLIKARVDGVLAAQGVDNTVYSPMFAYLLRQVSTDKSQGTAKGV